MSDQFAPFRGLTVLDLSRLLPGPWASAMLAEHGATVVKVEDLDRGDYSRYNAPFVDGRSVYFEAVNRHKVGLRLDLKDPDDHAGFLELVRDADVVIEAFRPGVMERLGLGYEALRAVNERIILCSLTGFGQHGPFAQAAGHDLNVAGVAGLLKFEDGRPIVPAIQMADYAAASNAVMSILAAIIERSRTGSGSWLDVSMLDSLLSWSVIRHAGALAAMAGSADGGVIEAFGGNPRYNVYECSDGRWVSVSFLETKFWVRFCSAMDRTDLVDPSESDADRLSTHGMAGQRYRTFLTETFLTRPRDVWVAQLQAMDLPCFPAYQPEEVFDDEHVRARGMLRRLVGQDGHPPTGSGATLAAEGFRAIGSPVRSLSHDRGPETAPSYREVTLAEARRFVQSSVWPESDPSIRGGG